MLKLLRAIPLILGASAVIYFITLVCIDNGDWTYVVSRALGLKEEHANNFSLIVLAAQSLFFTSNWFYNHIKHFIDRHLERAKGINRQIYLGYRTGIEGLVALPKRTILFTLYLILIISENIGIIEKAKNYSVGIVFIIAIDRVAKIWPEEKQRLYTFTSKMYNHIRNIG